MEAIVVDEEPPEVELQRLREVKEKLQLIEGMEEAIEQIDLKIAKLESKKESKNEGHPNTRKPFEDACAFEQKMKKALGTKEEDVNMLREKLAVAEREAEEVKAKHASAVQLKQQAL
eukprot:4085290-Alexandrium_andersonii.AAC.1